MKFKVLFFILLLLSCTPEFDLLIRDVNVIDMESGVILRRDVLIRDSLIVEIAAPHSASRSAAKILEGSGHYLMPGLWDMHVHIQDSTYLSMFLDYGITGVRDMGGCVQRPTDGCESLCPTHLNCWKKAIQEGTLEGPQLVIAGRQLSRTGWPTAHSVSTEEDVGKAFAQNLRDEVDFIKVYEDIPWESYQEIARLAKQHHLDFAGHVSEPFLLSDILDLGQKSIEHMREPLLYSFTGDSLELEQFMEADGYTEEDREFVQPWIADAEEVVRAFQLNKAWFTPTMAVQYARLRYEDKQWIHHPLRKRMPPSVNAGMQAHLRARMASPDQKGDSLWWMALSRLVKRFSTVNIGMLAGSDAACEGGLPGYSLHEELFLMVEGAGLTPLEALRTATVNPAAYFALGRQGQVRETYYANLLLLSHNPLENIRNTQTIKAVIKNGRLVREN
ncbi:Dihydroorotase [Muriicola jejuensis]|uniref:Amidohydrolase family protein n=1 Tax=Muriicola jejuensis TaxID=504488 RepID=A0A6P0UDN7_9FLAO|nr:amidohydrolase family protein [Muriicola jejuensis]NER09828.1 amidohydrolase family protein [Muriicola jejuensis]SMP05359.1 Dihydroorotase [Muriicola jejuensis]